MRGLLVRVGADQSDGGGSWNGPMDSATGRFAYVPIPEEGRIRRGLEKPYRLIEPALKGFGKHLPSHLVGRRMHLDPDFNHMTYGDQGQRAKQITSKVGPGDLLVFYAGLSDIKDSPELVYALIGLFVIAEIVPANEIVIANADMNAHTRRLLPKGASDIVVRGQPGVSGRLELCLPIGEFRERAYRVRREFLKKWGEVSVKDGYLQRSARLPELCHASRFYDWFERQGLTLMPRNN